MVDKLVNKRKIRRKIAFAVIGVCILAAAIAGAIVVNDRATDAAAEEIKAIVLVRAKEDCHKANIGSAVCDGLYAETAPPPWGPDWWAVHVYPRGDSSFRASARVDFGQDGWGNPRIIDYSVY